LFTGLALVFGWTGYLVIRIDCISYFVVRPCDVAAGIVGVVFWIIAVAMFILARKLGGSFARNDG